MTGGFIMNSEELARCHGLGIGKPDILKAIIRDAANCRICHAFFSGFPVMKKESAKRDDKPCDITFTAF